MMILTIALEKVAQERIQTVNYIHALKKEGM